MKLEHPTDEFITTILKEFYLEGDHKLNEKLLKLFELFADETDKYDVLIKVAALNKLYSTAIVNINPVAAKINKVSEQNSKPENIEEYIKWVDAIASVKWTNDKEKTFERTNLSFASKYVHFLSNYQTPIYDSYIWIVVKGYLGQSNKEKTVFTEPSDYKEFYETFDFFKKSFNLEKYSNYDIDKFLWFYGKKMIKNIQEKDSVELDKAKSELRNRIKSTNFNLQR